MKPASEMSDGEWRDEVAIRREWAKSSNLATRKRAEAELAVLMSDQRARPSDEEVEAFMRDLPF